MYIKKKYLKFSLGGFIEIGYVMFIIQIYLQNIQNAIILEDAMKRMHKLNPFSAQTQQNSPFLRRLNEHAKKPYFCPQLKLLSL